MALARTAELLGDRDEVERLVGDARETPSFLPLTARLALWRRDAGLAAELLRDLRPDTLPKRMAQLFLTILVTGQAPEELPMPASDPALRTPRARSFAAQLHAECNAVLGRRDSVLAAIERAAAAGVTDVAWLEGCPLFDELRADPRFTAASEVIAAKAERVVAAYLAPVL